MPGLTLFSPRLEETGQPAGFLQTLRSGGWAVTDQQFLSKLKMVKQTGWDNTVGQWTGNVPFKRCIHLRYYSPLRSAGIYNSKHPFEVQEGWAQSNLIAPLTTDILNTMP